MIDMPVHQLETYRGTNPCPDDLDSYWNGAIEEMKSINPQVEIKKADFQIKGVKCFDMYYTGVRKGRIYTKLLVPEKTDQQQPALLRFHGYHGNTGDWTQYLSFVLSGFTVAAMDVRGQGGKSTDGACYQGSTIKGQIIRGLDDQDKQNLAFRHIFLDTAQLAHIIMSIDEVDEKRVGCYGNSQGGGLSVACAALEPHIKLMASQHPFLSDYRRVWELDLAKQAYDELSYYFRAFDPLHKREDEIFHRLGYIDIKNLAKRIRAKSLFSTGLMDTVCPPSTVFAAYNNVRSEKEILVYPDYTHENMDDYSDRMTLFFKELCNG